VGLCGGGTHPCAAHSEAVTATTTDATDANASATTDATHAPDNITDAITDTSSPRRS
jgi:hypothetical protein